MKKTNINTGVNNFRLIDRITILEDARVAGIKTFTNSPAFLGLEAMAQLGAFHVRYLIKFERHAFLLKIGRCRFPVQTVMDGKYVLSGKIIGRSSSAFSYSLQAEKDDMVDMEGEFVFATVDYDMIFKKEVLKPYYQNIYGEAIP